MPESPYALVKSNLITPIIGGENSGVGAFLSGGQSLGDKSDAGQRESTNKLGDWDAKERTRQIAQKKGQQPAVTHVPVLLKKKTPPE